ncbi:EamA family transporter [Microvirga sp. KLBC 81]|uniref:DMT family transporter n=1 Tax=Microvirga sp. KLBC 81 TaxID=1862707 RepID=UPI000D518D8D|nr:DMT family transporter [Microvirga sp. KLBC 81]PVE23575.1 EamA family transporter [Microvirga sp. KLBC 81]
MTRGSTIPTNEPSISRDRPLRGIALMIAALAFFSCSDAASKLMTASLPAVEVAWLRFCAFTFLMLGAATLTGRLHDLQSRRPRLQTLRALGVLGSSVFFIMGLGFLPMAEATAIAFVSPVIVTALSIPILGEVVGWRRWSAVAVGLLGVLIVVRPGTGAFDTAAIFPILSAASWAVALVVTRKMSGSDGPLTSLTYAAIVGLLITSAIVPFGWVTPGWREIGLGFVTGVTSTIAQWLVVLAFQQARASVLAPFSYSQLVWSGLLGYLVFGNVPDEWTLIGAGVIIASGLYTAHRERTVRVSSALAK